MSQRTPLRAALPTAAALLVAHAAAAAQVVPGRFQVSVQGAWQRYAESAALDPAPLAGLEGTFFLNRFVGIGAHLLAGRPWTRGDYFPYVRHTALSTDQSNDTTLLYRVRQRVTHLQVGADAVLRAELGRLAPYATAGAGYYRFFLDPQQVNGLRDLSGPAFHVGGGLELHVSPTAGLRLAITDQVLLEFDRDRFCVNCTGAMALLREDRFPNPDPPPPPKESTIHNLRFTAAFSFVPGGQP
ncbi:MAG TPA: outer membrane beta-barrel protein [Gemmatimonadales bacterium]|nr:outer membrane beta-barrel protein [Gemmatimonadales bacterium]